MRKSVVFFSEGSESWSVMKQISIEEMSSSPNSKAQGLYSLYDCKGECFTPPFVARNDFLARRTVAVSLKSSAEILPSKYPADFILYRLIGWSDFRGLCIMPDEPNIPVPLGTVASILSDDRAQAPVVP